MIGQIPNSLLNLKTFCCTLVFLLLAACVPAPADSNLNNPNPLLDSSGEMVRGAPTQPPPAWIDSAEAVTLETVPRIQLLGRLDSALAPSTIFDHSLAPDGTRLAGLDNEQLLVWDLITGETVFSTGRREATRVFFSADKTEVYLLELSGLVTIHNADNGTTQNTFSGISDYDGVVAYYGEDGWLALGNRRGQVRVWDPIERTSLVTFDAHELAVRVMIFSDDGEWLATADNVGGVKVWDWRNRALIAEIDNERPAQALSFAPDKSRLAAGSSENIRLWSLPGGEFERLLDTGPGAVQVMGFSPDGAHLVNGGDTPEMLIWNPETGNLVARLPDVGAERLSMAFSPDGTLLLTSVLNGPVTLWNMTTITENTVNRADLDIGSNYVYSVDWTSDSRLLTLFGMTGSVYLWGIPPASVSD